VKMRPCGIQKMQRISNWTILAKLITLINIARSTAN